DVEVVGREWQIHEVGVVDVLETSHAAERQRLIREVDARGTPQWTELLERQACAAARIEDLEVIAPGVPLMDPVEHDLASRGVPPGRSRRDLSAGNHARMGRSRSDS